MLREALGERAPAWLAAQVGVSDKTVWGWLPGHARPDVHNGPRVAAALGVPVDVGDGHTAGRVNANDSRDPQVTRHGKFDIVRLANGRVARVRR